MIVRASCTLFECLRDRCQRTAIDRRLSHWPQTVLFLGLWLSSSSTGLWLRALGHEFVQIARAIIHAAVKPEKAPNAKMLNPMGCPITIDHRSPNG
jgi:hypothetical protein